MAAINYRIETQTAFKMMMVCLLFDLLGIIGLIPIIGTAIDWVLTACAEFLFYFWFRQYGVSYVSSTRGIVATVTATIVETFFGFLPAISLQMGIIISTSWAEDAITGAAQTETRSALDDRRPKGSIESEDAREGKDTEERRQMQDMIPQ